MMQLSGLKRSLQCTDLCSMTSRPSPTCFDEDDASATGMVSFPSLLQADDLDILIEDVMDLSMSMSKRQRRESKKCLQPATAALEAALAESQATMQQLDSYIADWAALNESSKPKLLSNTFTPSRMVRPSNIMAYDQHSLSRMARTLA
jgi:hypothetical protein